MWRCLTLCTDFAIALSPSDILRRYPCSLQPGGPEDEGEAKRLRKGSGDVASEIDSPSVSLADKMQRIRLTCPSDLRIDWTPFTCCGGMHEWECYANAQTFALRLIRSPLAKVAHVKFGMTQNPYFRFTTLPHDPASDTTVEPHYLHWSRTPCHCGEAWWMPNLHQTCDQGHQHQVW